MRTTLPILATGLFWATLLHAGAAPTYDARSALPTARYDASAALQSVPAPIAPQAEYDATVALVATQKARVKCSPGCRCIECLAGCQCKEGEACVDDSCSCADPLTWHPLPGGDGQWGLWCGDRQVGCWAPDPPRYRRLLDTGKWGPPCKPPIPLHHLQAAPPQQYAPQPQYTPNYAPQTFAPKQVFSKASSGGC